MSQPHRPSFIYFDLGNVLVRFDHQRASRAMAQLASVSLSAAATALFEPSPHLSYEGDNKAGSCGTMSWQDRFETGVCSASEFCSALRELLSFQAEDAMILRACSDIFWIDYAIVPVVHQLHAAHYPMGILSNTCEAHWHWLTAQRFVRLLSPFQPCMLSYETGAMKPAAAIYQAAATAAGFAPSEILFVDDRSENVTGALECGFDAVRFSTAPQLIRDLHVRGVLANF